MLGRWRYGLFSMIPVGATSVGSIKIKFDTVRTLPYFFFSLSYIHYPDLTRLQELDQWNGMAAAVRFPREPATKPSIPRIALAQQSASSVHRKWRVLSGVLVFEALEMFEFVVWPRQKVHVGNRLGDMPGAVTAR